MQFDKENVPLEKCFKEDGKTKEKPMGSGLALSLFLLHHSPAGRASPVSSFLASTFKVLHVIPYFGRKKGTRSERRGRNEVRKARIKVGG